MTDFLTAADLENRKGGDRITVPADWEKPADASTPFAVQHIGPGWALTHDGSGDGVPWRITKPHSSGCQGFADAADVEALRIPREAADWIDVDEETIDALVAALDALPLDAKAVLDPPRELPAAAAEKVAIPGRRMIGRVRRADGPFKFRLLGVTGDREHEWYAGSDAVLALGLTADDFDVPVVEDDEPASETPKRREPLTGDKLRGAYSHVHVKVDGAPFADGVPLSVGEAAPADAPETDDDGAPLRQCADDECTCNGDGEEGQHTVRVRVIPDLTGFREAVEAELPDQRPMLDEWQLERVASLEHALRVLESRRAPAGAEPGTFASLFGKRPEVPMVGKRDLIDVAAFIADGDTGRTEVSA